MDYLFIVKKNYIEIEVNEELKDYLNWGLCNGKLVYYFDDLNGLINNRIIFFVGNVMLNFVVIFWVLFYILLIGKVILDYFKYVDIKVEYGLFGLIDDNMKIFVSYKWIIEK